MEQLTVNVLMRDGRTHTLAIALADKLAAEDAGLTTDRPQRLMAYWAYSAMKRWGLFDGDFAGWLEAAEDYTPGDAADAITVDPTMPGTRPGSGSHSRSPIEARHPLTGELSRPPSPTTA